MIRWLCSVALLLALSTPLHAEVRLPAIFGDGMVLQRESRVPVWGWTRPGATVTVRFAGQTKTAIAERTGRFTVVLEPMEAAGPRLLSVEADGSRVTLERVLTGEVWLCSGQSNMAWPVSRSQDAKVEIATADHPRIRLFTVPRKTALAPASDVEGRWVICSPMTVGGFSAVAYFFGRAVHAELGVPIGLINTSYGGTPAEAWTPMTEFRAVRSLAPLIDRWRQAAKKYDPEKAKAMHARRLQTWKKAAAAAREADRRVPVRPSLARDPRLASHFPGSLWNAMVAPLVPFSFRGVIWYQGESNASRADQYRTIFPLMIESWRREWRSDFPFGFVQLANFRARTEKPGPSAWAELREAQRETLDLVEKTGMTVVIDIGEAGNIHPKNKQEVGRRLALWARATVYGEEVEYSGPAPGKTAGSGKSITVSFTHAKGLKTTDGEPPVGFTIAGKDGVFRNAVARINRTSVVLSHPEIRKPRWVRYGWANNPPANLVNGDGLPATPFRTDDLPLTTAGKN